MQSQKSSILNPRVVVLLTIIDMVIITFLVFGAGPNLIFRKFEITLSLIALSLFVFLFIGLFKGLRLKKDFIQITDWEPIKSTNFSGALISEYFEVGDGFFGIIVSLLISAFIWVFASCVFEILFWFLTNFVLGFLFVLFVMVFWVLYRAFRQVLIKSRKCRGKLLPSLKFSLYYTMVYTGWVFIVIWIWEYYSNRF